MSLKSAAEMPLFRVFLENLNRFKIEMKTLKDNGIAKQPGLLHGMSVESDKGTRDWRNNSKIQRLIHGTKSVTIQSMKVSHNSYVGLIIWSGVDKTEELSKELVFT